MSKFQIKLNSGLPGVKASVGAGATVTATIDNTAGFGSFSWSVAGTDETTDWEAVTASIVTSGARNETATFVVGGVGSAVCIQAVADGGISQRTGAADPTLVATAKVFVPAANGAEVITINETRESDAKWAYTAPVNNAIRATYGGGPVLSDANPQPLGTADPGVAGTAMRGDAVIPHGDLAGGSLHAVAVASTGGVGGSAGFASAADKEAVDKIPGLVSAVGALPGTYAPIVHTHDHGALTGLGDDDHPQYVLRTDGTSVANSNKWMIRNAQARAEAMGLTHTATTKLDVLGPGDLELIAGSNPALTTAAALLRGRTGVKIQVNDSTTPATVRTPLEITREAGGVGTADLVRASGRLACGNVEVNSADPNKIVGDGAWMSLGTDDVVVGVGGTLKISSYSDVYGSTPHTKIDENGLSVCSSTATAGQLRVIDGEIMNVKGSTGSEVCLYSFNKTTTRVIFGSDGANARRAESTWLSGTTDVRLTVGDYAMVTASAGRVAVASGQFTEEVATSAEITTVTKTLDASLGNVHVASISASSTCTLSLSNTKKGAEMEFFFTKSGSGVGVTLSPTWFDLTFSGGASDVIPFNVGAGGTTIHIRGRVLADGGKLFVTRVAA